MKKVANLFLVLFVAFTLAFSIISTFEAKADFAKECIGWTMFEARVHAYFQCTCHGGPSQYTICDVEYGCHEECTPTFCD